MSGQASHQWFRLEFPNVVEPEQLGAFLRTVHGLSSLHQSSMAFVAVGRGGHIEHYLRLPTARAGTLLPQAKAAVPGLVLVPGDAPDLGRPQAAWRVWFSSSRRPLRRDAPAAIAQTLLTALATASADETVSLQWLLGPVRRPLVVPTRHAPVHNESWLRALISLHAPGRT